MFLIKKYLRKIRKIIKRTYWRTSMIKSKIEIDSEVLENKIRSVGVKKGDILFVHSSLSALGYILGGPNAIVDTLMRVVSPEGTILMPVYPFQGSMLEYFSSTPTFNVAEDKSQMGAVTESFRKKTIFRSKHPSHSVASWGKDAEWFVKDHQKDNSPFGKNSPFFKAYIRKGKVLCIGSDIGQVTIYHVAEELTDFPKEVYLKKIYEAKVITPENKKNKVISKVHDPTQTKYRIDNDINTRKQLEKHFIKMGCLKTISVGKGKCSLIEIDPTINMLIKGAKSGCTIYGDLNNL
jgi:aminoglycoside 3-N-acetyltransferase